MNRNVLFITVDQWRGDSLSALGHPVLTTPALDGLAAEGTLFANHWANAAPCGPSRACLYTGTYLHHNRSVTNGTPLPRNQMDFSGLKVDFTRSPGHVALHDGVVRGPVLGGTIDGVIDYTRDDVHLRGTLIPLYGANNLLGQLPVVGLFLGGEKEGLVGVTYEVVGRPGTPVLHVNPLSALAPGLLRKVFEYPANSVTIPSQDDTTNAVDDTRGH